MSLNCYSITETKVCHESVAGVCTELTATRKYGLDVNGEQIQPSIIYTDSEGVPFDVSAGTVHNFECPLPKTTSSVLCELLADGTEQLFERCVTIKVSPSGIASTPVVRDYLLDYSAEYIVVDQDSVVPAPPKCTPLVNVGIQDSWSDLK